MCEGGLVEVRRTVVTAACPVEQGRSHVHPRRHRTGGAWALAAMAVAVQIDRSPILVAPGPKGIVT